MCVSYILAQICDFAYLYTAPVIASVPTTSASPTSQPTSKPTSNPTTTRPTGVPSKGPTKRPTLVVPGPTKKPSDSPSAVTNTQQTDDGEMHQLPAGDQVLGLFIDAAEMRIAVYVVFSCLICCICICVTCGLYKHCYAPTKQMHVIQQELQQSNGTQSNEMTVPQSEKDSERDEVNSWLRHTV
eukprot:782692_1